MKIEGKTAIITGGASGLGEAAARMMVEQGGQVILLDLNEERGTSVAEELGKGAAFIKTDITISEDVQAAIDFALEQFKQIDIVINCAGIAPRMKIASKKGPHSLEVFRKAIEINLIGPFDVMRLAADKMLSNEQNDEEGRGVIINTASIAAFDGQTGQAAYAASKAALIGMTLPVARDLAGDGIRICTIAPGIFKTPMLAGLPENVQESLVKTMPFPSRLGNPQEFAMLVQQIIENPMLNGETIRLDGSVRLAAQ
ncbi:MAG: SDR family NAD(P)-dependent oxidoreductase [Syntrophomonas sp.]|nr:SDR family NAD(P)-dependent oxidoreductase [Syntrophomonas sp.]